MARGPRIHYDGAVYHVMARGVDGRDIFLDDLDRRAFLEATRLVKNEAPFTILAYCLMGNHFHFAIRVGGMPLSRIMQRLLTSYVMAFNLRHDRQGHLFQARYKAVLCRDDAYLIALIRYIHMNPVRAGIVSSPESWPWSSHFDYIGRGSDLADARLFFNALGENGVGYAQVLRATDDSFEAWPSRKSESPLLRDEPADVQTLEQMASDLFPDDHSVIRSGCRRHAVSRKRRMFVEMAIQKGHKLTAIADWMGRSPQAVHNLINRKELKK